MKLRADIVEVYRQVHSWVGILAGLFLFVAFYAGAISMFEQTLQNWLTPASSLPAPVSLERTPELMDKAFAAFPEARKTYTIVLAPDNTQPARLVWPRNPHASPHAPSVLVAAALDAKGDLVTATQPPSEVAHFIDVLHQRMGLPLPDAVAMPIMGLIALLYALALVSGTIAYLPALKKTLFAVRLEGGKRKAWLDLHNVFGFFSLPFHIVTAVTSVVFAFHEPIFAMQDMIFHKDGPPAAHVHAYAGPPLVAAGHVAVPLEPAALVAALAQEAPGFVPSSLTYALRPGPEGGKLTLRVAGNDPRFVTRGPFGGFAGVDPATGHILSGDYLPGHQPTGFAVITSFFTLHFGSYGGAPVRWGYLVLGFAGAFLFYTGNQLWVVARRRRERGSGVLTDTRGTRLLYALTIGCCAGCVSGLAVVIAVAALSLQPLSYMQAALLYYAVFVLCVLLAFCLPADRKAPLLFLMAGVSNVFLAAAALVRGWHPDGVSWAVAVVALALAAGLLLVPVRTGIRKKSLA